MNLYVIPRLTFLPLDRRRCPTRLKIRPIRPVVIVRCFLDPGLRNINRLVLIPPCHARATRAGASPRDAPATRAGGRVAFPIRSGAFPILWPGR